MNPELISALKVGLVVLQLAFVLGIIAWMVHQGRVFRCPSCRASIALAAIRITAISCPNCGWRVERKSFHQPVSVPATAECNRCCNAPPLVGLVALWDGKLYCHNCLDAADPLLAEYAKSHTTLAETVPFSILRAIWGGLCLTTIVAAMIAGLFALLGIVFSIALVLQGQMPANGFGAVAGLLWVTALMFAFSWGFAGTVSFPVSIAMHWLQRPRTLLVANGRVTIKPPGDRFYELATVRWAEGTSRFDAVECMCWPWRRGIVLFPHRGDEQSRYRTEKVGYIVGVTPGMFAIWKAFLTLANIPVQQTRPWKLHAVHGLESREPTAHA